MSPNWALAKHIKELVILQTKKAIRQFKENQGLTNQLPASGLGFLTCKIKGFNSTKVIFKDFPQIYSLKMCILESSSSNNPVHGQITL